MRILITGAAGYYCQEAIAQLAARGHKLRLGDIVEMETEHEFVKCDVLDPEDLVPAMEGIDAVLHTVIGRPKEPDTPAGRVRRESRAFAISVMGTFNVLETAAEVGVPKVVMVGSEAARGQKIPRTDVEVCDEETRALPDGTYGLGKYVMEVIAEYFTRVKGIKTVVLRNGWFGAASGKDMHRMATKLLYQRGLSRYDLVRAAVLAIENESLEHEVFLLTNTVDFRREDVPTLRADPEAAIEKYYPGAVARLKDLGVDLQLIFNQKQLWKLDDNSKAERLLGWKPSFTFRDFYQNMMQGKYKKGQVVKEEVSA